MELDLDADPEQQLPDRGVLVADRSGIRSVIRVRRKDQRFLCGKMIERRALEAAMLESQLS